MKCPKCQSPFTRVDFQGIQIDRCVSCHGMWFDALELKDLLAKKGSEKIDIGDERDYAKTSQVEDYLCPKDGTRMIKMVDVKQSHVWYESCGTCYGMFLDATELSELKDKSLMDIIRTLKSPERKA
jgi:Zn-finger nucleic acid-binding protein